MARIAFQRSLPPLLLLLAELHPLAVVVQAAGPCKEYSLDFILNSGEALNALIEDDIKRDLANIGITVNTRMLEKDPFNTAMTSGDYDLCFTESWGPPYDPHAYATSWFVSDEAHFPAMNNLKAPMTKATLEQKVSDVLGTTNLVTRQEKWTEILQEMHMQAISNPMWARRMPAVMNRRLQGYVAGPQQFDYPMHLLEVASGPTSVKVTPGGQGGLSLVSTPLEPHTYRPNEFFLNNWIYEGLVHYGQGGSIEPALATGWTVTDIAGGGQEYRFVLRENVKFHDGTEFNCSAVEMNFAHVLQPLVIQYSHTWYALPESISSWSCDGEVFVVQLNKAYYPFLQELTYIRPLRILSPESFAQGPTSDPVTANSCPPRWSPIPDADGNPSNVVCAGIRSTHGTGPWKFVSQTLNGDDVTEMKLARNPDHWARGGNVDELVVKTYATSDLVEAALLDGSLDMVVGGSVLTPSQVKEFQTTHVASFQVIYGPPLMNTIVVMNIEDHHLRRVIMHAIDKAAIVRSELAGSTTVSDSLFPKEAPYCDVDLTPRFDYDFDKAQLMNCPEQQQDSGDDDNGPSTGLIVGLVVGGVVLLLIVGAVCFLVGRRAGYNQMRGNS